jgi:hypothetical protein
MVLDDYWRLSAVFVRLKRVITHLGRMLVRAYNLNIQEVLNAERIGRCPGPTDCIGTSGTRVPDHLEAKFRREIEGDDDDY